MTCPRCFGDLPTGGPCPRCNCCRNCGSTRAPFRKGRCEACSRYSRRTGKERPLELVEAKIYRQIDRELKEASA